MNAMELSLLIGYCLSLSMHTIHSCDQQKLLKFATISLNALRMILGDLRTETNVDTLSQENPPSSSLYNSIKAHAKHVENYDIEYEEHPHYIYINVLLPSAVPKCHELYHLVQQKGRNHYTFTISKKEFYKLLNSS